MIKKLPHIILFDGVCNLCSGSVNFIIRRDKIGIFKFATLQSETGQILLKENKLSTSNLDTFVFISEGNTYTKSTAALKVMKKLGRGWQLFYAFIIIPPFIRDFIYDLVARYRYQLFGKRSRCRIASPKEMEKFL